MEREQKRGRRGKAGEKKGGKGAGAPT